MRDLLRQARSELRLLPFMLGKLVGGVMAALGAAAAVAMLGNRPGTSPSDALPYAVAAVAGIIVFAVSSRMLSRRSGNVTAVAATPAPSLRMSVVSWTVLLLLAAGFLLGAFLSTR
jgi:hypothetical protein